MKVLLIGSGQMSVEYSKILNSLKIDYLIFSRTKDSLKKFQKNKYTSTYSGKLNQLLNDQGKYFTHAIIVTTIESLKNLTIKVINADINNILIEKPGSLNLNELIEIKKKSKNKKIFIGYNRRFLSSIIKLKNILIKEKVESAFFSFNEQSKIIEKLSHSKLVKNNWVLANSSHVIDLIFYLIGLPKNLSSFTKGYLNWHKLSSKFYGNGLSRKSIIFSYASDWNSPGKWTIELMTSDKKFILSPLEKIQYMDWKSFNLKEVKINSTLDKLFKPGLYLQTQNFLNGTHTDLCSIDYQVNQTKIIYKIAGYKK